MLQNQFARMLIACATVGVWMALGWALRLDPNSYLLVGVPLLLLFQIFVARRPLTELWLRNRAGTRVSWWIAPVAVLFAIYPVINLVQDGSHASLSIRLWGIAALLGSLPLAWTLTNANRKTWTSLLGCFLTAGFLGSAIMVLTSMAHHHGFKPHRDAWAIAVGSFLLYLPICFVIEEVFFRGGLDSFVQRESDKHGWLTAPLISILWGWWHLPILTGGNWIQFIGLFVAVPVILCFTGVPFSIYWRRSGSLLVPAIVHAFIDSVRNAIM